MIREAVDASPDLSKRSIQVFLQGSYHNNTNVRLDSDVDVGVLCTDTFFYNLQPEQVESNVGIEPATYLYSTFKDELGRALVAKFGASAVDPGNKAFDIKETSSRVEADVAPFFEHRRYRPNGTYEVGVELLPDNRNPLQVVNWPKQHHSNGVNKNNTTGRRYKSLVRILKHIRNEMGDSPQYAHRTVPGFLIECLVWNVPNNLMVGNDYETMVRSALTYLYKNTLDYELCSEWGEVSELKYLFRGPQPWSFKQANDFTVAAWNYLGYDC